jgi:hypothetical protein
MCPVRPGNGCVRAGNVGPKRKPFLVSFEYGFHRFVNRQRCGDVRMVGDACRDALPDHTRTDDAHLLTRVHAAQLSRLSAAVNERGARLPRSADSGREMCHIVENQRERSKWRTNITTTTTSITIIARGTIARLRWALR